MSDYDYLNVSDGTGDAALMHITAPRSIGGTVITVDGVVNVPDKFIASYGDLGSNGLITPASKRDFKGHILTGTLVIDAFEPGSTDAGNTEGQVVVIKPNTGWADRVADYIQRASIQSFTSASEATPTPNSDTASIYMLTAQAAAAAFGAPTGTPIQGRGLIIRVKDDGTARALTWNAIYRPMGNALPTTTILGKTLYCGFIYNATDTKWDLIALAQEV